MYKKILVPVALDHGPNTQQALSIARTLVDEGGEVHALTVVEPIPGYVSQYLPEAQEDSSRKKILEALKETLKDHPDLIADVIVGHAGRSIVEFSDQNDCDCIVIASHQPGLQDFFLGSTAARVVRHAHCAVHIIR